MVRALGGNRPVGPACASDYRAGHATAQYDAVLASGAAFGEGNRLDAASP
jgi:hypothetical protein